MRRVQWIEWPCIECTGGRFVMTKSSVGWATALGLGRDGRPDRPTALPDVHGRLTAGWRHGGAWHRVVHAIADLGQLAGDPDAYAAFEISVLQRASLWWVSPEMCTLLEVAMQQLPHDIVLDDDVLLDRAGFCMFATPMLLTDAGTGTQDLVVDAVGWGPLYIDDAVGFTGPGIGISSYTWYTRVGCAPLGRSEWVEGQALDAFVAGQLQRGPAYCTAAAEDRRLLAAVALLARQEHLVETTTVVPDRSVQRRAVRDGRAATVRVVRVHPRHAAPGSSGGSLAVRTIVRGHWRRQPCGPGRTQRRTVWIAPHLRGPDAAPLVIRPTVRVV